MKKAFLSVGAVCLIILLAVSFSAATCTVTPGPSPTTYTMIVTNNAGIQLYLEVYSDSLFLNLVRWNTVSSGLGSTGAILAEPTYYFRVRNVSTNQYLQFTNGNTWWYVTGSMAFTVGGGGWVTEAR